MLTVRYIRHGENIENLVHELGHLINVTTLSIILSHGAIILAVFWAPHHLRLFTPPAVPEFSLKPITLNNEHITLHILVSDNTEIAVNEPSDLVLSYVLFSEKSEKPGYIKQLYVCYQNGTIALRAPYFGGAADEITPLEYLSSMFQKELTQLNTHYVLLFLLDRGFRKVDVPFPVWYPTFLEKRVRFTASEAISNQVPFSIPELHKPKIFLGAISESCNC